MFGFYIHRQRKEWDAKEKEMVAYQLITLVEKNKCCRRPVAFSMRELDRLMGLFELSERFKGAERFGGQHHVGS